MLGFDKRPDYTKAGFFCPRREPDIMTRILANVLKGCGIALAMIAAVCIGAMILCFACELMLLA